MPQAPDQPSQPPRARPSWPARTRRGLGALLLAGGAVLVPPEGLAQSGGGQSAGTPPLAGQMGGAATGTTPETVQTAALLQEALRATVQLYAPEGAGAMLGSGFLFGPRAYLVTNAHVARDHPRLTARFGDGRQIGATLLRRDAARDLAVFTLDGPAPAPGLSAAATPPRLGQSLYALGAPLELAQSVTRGSLSHPARQVDPAVPLHLYQHDAAINPGSSGGPLLNGAGRVVAVNARIADGSRFFTGVSYAIPIAVVQGLIADSLVPVPNLGLHLRPLPAPRAALLGLTLEAPALLVDDITPGGAAARAGVRPGDVLIALDDRPLPSPGALAFALADRGGPALRLRLLRPGATPRERALSLTLTAADLPQPAPSTTATGSAPTEPVDLGLTLDADNGQVLAVAPDSPAFAAGLAPGDRIEAVNGAAGAQPAPRALSPQLLRLARDGRQLHLLLDPAAAPSLARPVTGNALDPAVIPF